MSSNFSLSWTPFHVNSLLRCVLFVQLYTPLFVCSTIPTSRESGVYTFLHISVNPILQSFWFLYRWLLLIRKLLNHEFLLVKFTSEVSQSLPWLGWPLPNIYVTNDHGYVPFAVMTIRTFAHSWRITGFAARVTLRAPLVYMELLSFCCNLVHSRSFCSSSFSHLAIGIVRPSSINGFWLPLGVFKIIFFH